MVIVLMGVTGCGKTTVGKLLADSLGWEFYDADNFHPDENVKKMSRGIPLTDEDRLPWLHTLSGLILQAQDNENNFVLACSALKKWYRDILRKDAARVTFVYLKGSPELIGMRLKERKGHFMNPALLESQFSTLEEPADALHMDISKEPEDIAADIRRELEL